MTNDEEMRRQLASLESRRSGLQRAYIEQVDRARDRLRQGERSLDGQIAAIRHRMRGELPVLVRWTIGPPVRCYHSATHTCGRVQDRSNYNEMSEAMARDERGLRECTACNWGLAVSATGQPRAA